MVVEITPDIPTQLHRQRAWGTWATSPALPASPATSGETYARSDFTGDLTKVSPPTAEDRADMAAAADARADIGDHGAVPWEQTRDELES